MSKNTTVSLTLQLKGNAAQELKKIGDEQVKSTTNVNLQWQKVGTAQAKFVTLAQKGKQETLNTAKAGDTLLRTNRMIEGVLRQQSIQTRLQTQQLKTQQAAAAQIANYMKQVEQSSRRTQQHTQQTTSSMSLLQKGAAIGGTAVGVGYMLQQPIKRTVDYDRDLHYAAQKLSDSPADWKPTKQWMNNIVVGNAVKGGVNRDTSFLALDELIADGAYNDDNLDKMKANLVKAHSEAAKSALASGGDIIDFAKVGLAAKKRNLDESKVQAMVIKADDLGAMSAKDIAKALPAQLGKLAADQVNNVKSVAQLIAFNEVAMKTAGTASEADTNVQNFLGKMYSSDTTQRLKKDHNINLPVRYAMGKKNDQTDFDVFLSVADEILAKDSKMQAVLKKLSTAKNNEEANAILETQKGIFEQSGLAAILPDMQALMGLVALKRYSSEWTDMTNVAMTKGEQTRNLKYEYNQTELASYGTNAFDVTRKNAEFQTLQSTVDSLGNMGRKVAELTEQYPSLIGMMGTTELALKTLAVAAGGAAIAQAVSSKGGPQGGLLSTKKGSAKNFIKGGSLVALAAGGYGLYSTYKDDQLSSAQKNVQQASIVGGMGGTLAGAATGAAIGSAVPVLGTIAGGLIGGGLGYWGGSSGGEAFAEHFNEQNGIMDSQSKLLEEQNKLSRDLSNKLSQLINVTSQNKPISFPTSSVGDRSGAVATKPLIFKDPY
ncbi:hypothetical protein [Acinetobacter haemolyticus]|uniref:hypothetical protein n=1 Tax=Acinetobacter haemolyticus TaxID=29430 RepID=UPI000F735E81|nr:hypothetical protein [Acinetobacter haemolyticus]RSN77892.1 hypothetical protein EA769_03475 [Acinetobacter haemolyticus]